MFGTGITTEESDTGAHLAEVRRRNWRWAPGAGSPGVGGGARCVPSLASHRLPAALPPRAYSPHVSAALRCAPHTPCWSCAAAASQLHELSENTQTHRETETMVFRGEVRRDDKAKYSSWCHHQFFICPERCVLFKIMGSLSSVDCATIPGRRSTIKQSSLEVAEERV